jgi:hypothetical protein
MNIKPRTESITTYGQAPAKPRPEWAEGCGPATPATPAMTQPAFRIMTNGRRYRVQKLVEGPWKSDAWEDVWADVRHLVEPFETRWLWLARRRVRREIDEAARKKLETTWRVV